MPEPTAQPEEGDADEELPAGLTFTLCEAMVTPGTVVHLDWVLNGLELNGLEITLALPAGFKPADEQGMVWDETTQTWRFRPQVQKGDVALAVDFGTLPPYRVTLELWEAGSLLSVEEQQWLATNTWDVAQSGGVAASPDGRIRIQFGKGDFGAKHPHDGWSSR